MKSLNPVYVVMMAIPIIMATLNIYKTYDSSHFNNFIQADAVQQNPSNSNNNNNEALLEKRVSELEETIKTLRRQMAPSTNVNSSNSPVGVQRLPSCKALMDQKDSIFANGEFLTRQSTHGSWIPRVDGSREYDLKTTCSLHRYTATEAKQCLAGKHLMFIGDSLTRFQMLALTYFLHKGHHPPRFKRPPNNAACVNRNEFGEPACSPPEEPNIVSLQDFRYHKDRKGMDEWLYLLAHVGGWDDGSVFDGHMECNCARSSRQKCVEDGCDSDNMLYTSPPIDKNNGDNNRVTVSLFTEYGWGDDPRPLHGFNFTDCSSKGTCRNSAVNANKLMSRAEQGDYDWSLKLLPLLQKQKNNNDDGVHKSVLHQLPRVDFTVYNRGLWGVMKKDRAAEVMESLRNVTLAETANQKDGRCFYKTTTGTTRSRKINFSGERTHVKDATTKAGCEFFDVAHVTEDFVHMDDPLEFAATFVDAIHYQPWVYAEINNVLLNVLCNKEETT